MLGRIFMTCRWSYMMLPFLCSSHHHTLEKAYEICVKKDLLRERVFVLGRMGKTKQAFVVIINKLGDMEEAVEFVSMQNYDELWEELIKQCINRLEMGPDGGLEPITTPVQQVDVCV